MKKVLAYIVASIIFLTISHEINAQSYSFLGNWEGSLTVPNGKLRIVFHIVQDEENGMMATLDSPDQGAYGIPCGDVTQDDDSVIIMVPQVRGKFEGTFQSQELIEGSWSQGGANLPLKLSYTEEVEELNRPQEPKPPFPYETDEVKIENKPAGVTLAGTLSIPQGQGPFPAAILVTGSGPQDRNETVFSHKPFLVISDYLARNGIAVLRYDDRGIGESTGDFSSATSEDFASDVIACFEFLKTKTMINNKMIGIIGHSEGGLIAPMVAAKRKDIGFIVLLAGPGLTGKDIILLQSRLISEVSGVSKEDFDRAQEFQKNAFDIVLNEPDPDKLDSELNAYIDEYIASLPENEKNDPANSRETIMQRLEQIKSPWVKYFLDYDPVSSLKKVKCPVLALNGEKDLQVPPKENLEVIEETLKKSGNKNYHVQELKDLNHLFQHCETGSPNEYANIEETFSEDALKIIGDWINGLN